MSESGRQARIRTVGGKVELLIQTGEETFAVARMGPESATELGLALTQAGAEAKRAEKIARGGVER